MVGRTLWLLSRTLSRGSALLRRGAARMQAAQAEWERRKERAALKGLDLMERAEYFLTGEVVEPDDGEDECK